MAMTLEDMRQQNERFRSAGSAVTHYSMYSVIATDWTRKGNTFSSKDLGALLDITGVTAEKRADP